MRLVFHIGLFLSLSSLSLAQTGLEYYLPANTPYDPEIPTPREVLDHEVGEWHVSHDKLVQYMRLIASKSPRISIEEYGRSYENRPLLLLTITSEKNHASIESLRERHHQLTDPQRSGELSLSELPAVVWLGYSVHGNEASGSNASLAVVYHLAAAQGEQIEQWLDNLIILVDPSINPDGLNRFASWVNMHRSKNLNDSPFNREQNENWPGGRTNHYWFDLNRDWLPLQHPESRGRIAQFHRWKPNVLTDHHEMGSNSTFFFQPGVPSRNHPLTPNSTYTLTKEISTYHANGLDEIGVLYYTKETFDDFYMGKGSTYPDLNGSIGILFEQASVRGHLRKTSNGFLEFPYAIKNHFRTSLSTLTAAFDLREKLLEHQRNFYRTARNEASSASQKAYVFGSNSSPSRTTQLASILGQHQIQLYQLGKEVSIDGKKFKPGGSYIVPTDQAQFRLIQAIFEKRIEFSDSLFYDVSAWTLPLAFDLDWGSISARSFSAELVGESYSLAKSNSGSSELARSEYAYLLNWVDYFAPKILYILQDHGLRLKVATRPFILSDGKSFGYGTILIPVKNQVQSSDSIYRLIRAIMENTGTDFYPIKTGYNQRGVDLGSPSFKSLVKPTIALMVGKGVNAYEAGEVWHLLDWRMDIDLTLLPIEQMDQADLNDFNTLILVDGNYGELSSAQQKIRSWIETGGSLIAFKRGAKWLSDNRLSKVKFKKVSTDSTLRRHYFEMDRYRGAQVIGGSIFSCQIDVSHPINYGYKNEDLAVFLNSKNFFERPSNAYSFPVVYKKNPLLSGYISNENLELISDSPVVIVSRFGKGKILSFAINPNFRAFWYGTNRLFLNSIFFPRIIDSKSVN